MPIDYKNVTYCGKELADENIVHIKYDEDKKICQKCLKVLEQ